MNKNKLKVPKKSKRKYIIYFLILAISYLSGCSNKNKNENQDQNTQKPKVKIMNISKSNESIIFETTGIVKPMKSVTVKSLINGTIVDAYIEQGNEVLSGQSLAYIYDENIETNYAAATNLYSIAQSSYSSTLSSAEENFRQAQINLDKAQESFETANLNNEDTKKNTEIAMDDALINAVISNESFLNTTRNTLDFVDGILGVDDDIVYGGLSNVFSVKDITIKEKAQRLYRQTKSEYEISNSTNINSKNIKNKLNNTITLLRLEKDLIDTTLSGLYSTITSADFSQTSLSTLMTNVITYQSSISGALSQAQLSYQAINNLEVTNKMKLDQSRSALKISELGLESAKTALSNAEQNKILTIGGAANSLQGAKINFDLSSINKSRQDITAPFSGVVSKKMIEVGDEVSPGQVLFEISVINYVKIESSIPYDDMNYLKIGDEVTINDNIKGILSKIDPVADSISKKINIEVGYDNSNMELVPESFANIKIPLSKLSEDNNVYIIPLKSVDLEQDKATVKIIEDNKIKIKEVKYLQITSDKIVISSGLSEGDQVVIENGKLLSEGTEVELEEY
ncbi:MAG: efflux RND transporter periplasmic adaptor subunit [Patescibacteria group bacterium]|nr:efflux RND transporter periplasmic adaptor subunit [Patescibacteria group bacterium]MDD4304118.1 efflux RND transporter periplasmic adaptor subunit [Patescibacteria group bacterium]MDD4694995.1 efflux RND transporter periplasmic adaptor subunit [Patescibacteria group bacterium]